MGKNYLYRSNMGKKHEILPISWEKYGRKMGKIVRPA
jgi:hypothetical protein